jgi:hypothetical protein
MTLSKQHFIKIADILRYNKDKPFNDLINEFIIYFESENPNFDKSRFLEYLNK